MKIRDATSADAMATAEGLLKSVYKTLMEGYCHLQRVG
jgi:hypothetical protein